MLGLADIGVTDADKVQLKGLVYALTIGPTELEQLDFDVNYIGELDREVAVLATRCIRSWQDAAPRDAYVQACAVEHQHSSCLTGPAMGPLIY